MKILTAVPVAVALQDDSGGVDDGARSAIAAGSQRCGIKRPASSRDTPIADKRVKAGGLKMEADDDDGRRGFPSPQRYAAGRRDSAAARAPSSSSSSQDDDSDDDGFSSSSSSSGSDCSGSQEDDDPCISGGRGGKRSTQLLRRRRRLDPQTSPPLHPPGSGSVRSGSGSGAPDVQRLAMAQLGLSEAMLDEDEDKVRIWPMVLWIA